MRDIGSGEARENMYAGQVVPEEVIDRALHNMHAWSGDQRPLPPGFEPEDYLAANPDVRAAGMDAAEHWRVFGYAEGRKLRA